MASETDIEAAKRHVDAILDGGGRDGAATSEAYRAAYPDDPRGHKRHVRSKLLVHPKVDRYRKEREAALVGIKEIKAMLGIIVRANPTDYMDDAGQLKPGLSPLQMVAVRRTNPVELRDPIVAGDKLAALIDKETRRQELTGAAASGKLSPDAVALALALQQVVRLDTAEAVAFAELVQEAASGKRERSVVLRAMALAVRIAQATRQELARLDRFLEAM